MFKNIGVILLFVALSLNLSRCTEKLEVSNLPPAEEQRVRQIGQKIAGSLLMSLQKELKKTIENDGMVAALSICNLRASQLTDSIKHSIDGVVSLKRTSLRYRNPVNSPDAGEREALISFQKSFIKTGILPEDMIIKINGTNEQNFRYYKPLLIKPLCLNCHGHPEKIAPEVANYLKKLYPEDHATGYSIDQFRGLVSISIK
jgi:hypothetical protein